jgi:undecaprenyl diphosphate synthase
MSDIPVHIAIIMDGNGRWAKARGLSRTQGHKQGLEAAKAVITQAAQAGIKYVTLYTFSTENWKRTESEVGFLMSLLKTHLRSELSFYSSAGIRVMHTGDINGLPNDIASELIAVASETASFSNTTVILAINYGGRDEIVRAIRKIPSDCIEAMTEDKFLSYLDIPELPPVDLMVRTGGEKRISNFLLWQSAYAEFYFSDVLWPDWNGTHLMNAINDYQNRERRFGGIK